MSTRRANGSTGQPMGAVLSDGGHEGLPSGEAASQMPEGGGRGTEDGSSISTRQAPKIREEIWRADCPEQLCNWNAEGDREKVAQECVLDWADPQRKGGNCDYVICEEAAGLWSVWRVEVSARGKEVAA